MAGNEGPEGRIIKGSVEDYASLLREFYRDFNLENPKEKGSPLKKLPDNSFEFILKSQLITGFDVSVYVDGKNEWHSDCHFYVLQKGCAYSLCGGDVDKVRVSVVIPYHCFESLSTENVKLVVPSGFCIRTKQKPDGHWFASLRNRHNILNILEYFWRCSKYNPGADTIQSVDIRRVKESSEKLKESLNECKDTSDYQRTARLLAETCELASASLNQLNEQGDQLQRLKEGSHQLKEKLSNADKLIKSLQSWSFSSSGLDAGGLSKKGKQLAEFNLPATSQGDEYFRIFPVLLYESTTYRPRLVGITMEKIIFVVDSSSCGGGIGESTVNIMNDLTKKCLEIPIGHITEINTGPAPFYMGVKYSQRKGGVLSGLFASDKEEKPDLESAESHMLNILTFSQIDILQILHTTHSYHAEERRLCGKIAVLHHGYDRDMPRMANRGLGGVNSTPGHVGVKHVTQSCEAPEPGNGAWQKPAELYEYGGQETEEARKERERNYDPTAPKGQLDINHSGVSSVQAKIEADHECLDQMVEMLGPLKEMATQITTELDVQSALLDEVTESVEDAGEKMKKTNKSMDKILKG
eukprot:Nk52_evm2s279 gene=Nk52_evmTU2s279